MQEFFYGCNAFRGHPLKMTFFLSRQSSITAYLTLVHIDAWYFAKTDSRGIQLSPPVMVVLGRVRDLPALEKIVVFAPRTTLFGSSEQEVVDQFRRYLGQGRVARHAVKIELAFVRARYATVEELR